MTSPESERRWLGIDVAVRTLHLALLRPDGRVSFAVLRPADLAAWLDERLSTLAGAAVDAPAVWADDAHVADDRVAPKFRRRCAEAVLAMRDPPHFVSWPSPAEGEQEAAAHGWVAVGVEVHGMLRDRGVAVDECWPHASWQRLTGRRALPRKASADGLALRRQVLASAGVDPAQLAGVGHDHLDAVVAALTAATVDEAERRRAACPDHSHPQAAAGIVLPTRTSL